MSVRFTRALRYSVYYLARTTRAPLISYQFQYFGPPTEPLQIMSDSERSEIYSDSVRGVEGWGIVGHDQEISTPSSGHDRV